MGSLRFESWCDHAVQHIQYKPDREAVRQELYCHLCDKRDALAAEGLPPDEAERGALRAMGDAQEVGEQLAAVHRPFLGYLLRFTRWALALAVAAALLALPGFVQRNRVESAILDIDLYSDTYLEYEDGWSRRVRSLAPGCSDFSDGYTFTVTRAVEWHSYFEWDDPAVERKSRTFYFLVEVKTPFPGAKCPEAPRWFYGVDSLGNYYYSSYEYGYSDEPSIVGNGYQTALFSYTYFMWCNNFVSEEAEWLELRYDRAGRDLRLRIDLTGGEAA